MGRQAYMNRLALGRSPFEAPESSTDAESGPRLGRPRFDVHADGYIQQYDQRGHPVNPESKQFGRQLRRAKNDILSTMGIVVSGEDGNLGMANDQQKMNIIASENDWGLIMATMDQVLAFLSSWWTTSLAGRVQAFTSYTHTPLVNIMRYERASVGLVGFHLAGIPSWAVSSCFSIGRHQPLERLIEILRSRLFSYSTNRAYCSVVRTLIILLRSLARGTLLVWSVQMYMHSLLQSLHLIQPFSIPAIHTLIPLTLPSVMPRSFSINSLLNMGQALLRSPVPLIYMCLHLRPLVEVRLYRLIRRRLPKPDSADDLSMRVAFDNDLIDWMVPSLGRRAEEESTRANLTLYEDIKYELSAVKQWLQSLLHDTWPWASACESEVHPKEQRIETLQHCIEELHNELQAAQTDHHSYTQPTVQNTQTVRNQGRGNVGIERSASPGLTRSTSTPEPEMLFNMDQVLPREEIRMSQSPEEMSSDYFHDISSLVNMRASAQSADTGPVVTTSAPQDGGDAVALPRVRSNSRSSTLFSRAASPESSPPSSPRVRASLIHQNSDIITMQLELLSNRNAHGQTQTLPQDNSGGEHTGHNEISGDRIAMSEFLDALVSSQGQSLPHPVASDVGDSDGLSNMTPGVSPGRNDLSASASATTQQDRFSRITEDATRDGLVEVPVSRIANILPDSIEEPPHIEDIENRDPNVLNLPDVSIEPTLPPLRAPATAQARHGPGRNRASRAHRVTILSSHPVDSLASNIASLITTVIFIPVESWYLRVLAVSYLSSAGTTSALQFDVRSPGAWFGGGSRTDMFVYMGKMLLLVSMQAAVNAGVWGVMTGTAIALGKRFCGWGTF